MSTSFINNPARIQVLLVNNFLLAARYAYTMHKIITLTGMFHIDLLKTKMYSAYVLLKSNKEAINEQS